MLPLRRPLLFISSALLLLGAITASPPPSFALNATATATATATLGLPIATPTATPSATTTGPTATPTSILPVATPTSTSTTNMTPTATITVPQLTPTPSPTPTATTNPTPVPGRLAVAPIPRLVNFGQVGVNTTSRPRLLILHNNTSSSVNGTASPMAPPFSLTPAGPFTIGAHRSASFKITFAPTSNGKSSPGQSANFALAEAQASASKKSPPPSVEPDLMVPVEGFGAPGRLLVSRTQVNFGTLRRSSQAPAHRPLRIADTGKGQLMVTVPQMTAPFRIDPSGNFTFKHGQGQTFAVTFYPNKTGPASETLDITSNDPNRPSFPVSVSGNSNFTPSPTATPTMTISLATPTATPTVGGGRATPTATGTLGLPAARTTPSVSGRWGTSGNILFAQHPMGGAMLGAPIASSAKNVGTFADTYVADKDVFRNAGRMQSEHVGATGTMLPNGKILIAGGGSCVEHRGGRCATTRDGTCVPNPGATRVCTATDTADLYDPAHNKFIAAGSGSGGKMSAARMGHTAVLISGCNCALDGDVLIAGGNPGAESVGDGGASSGSAPLSSAELYDYRTDSFVALDNAMGSAREGAIAAAIPGANGKILIAGGDRTGFFQDSIASAEIFDPAGESFSPTGAMNTAREFAGAVVLDPAVVSGPDAGDILVAGGIAATGNLTGTSLDSAELYDPVSTTWTAVGAPMAHPRALHSMTLFSGGPDSGQVLIAGGVAFDAHGKLSGMSRSSHADAQLFDPSSGTFSAAGSMNGSRGGHGAALLGSGPHAGNVLVAGGQRCGGSGCGAAHPVAELYDPATASWSASKAKMSPPIGAVLGGVVPVP